MYLESKGSLRPKKHLGQIFLVDKNIQKKIIDYCQFKKDDVVLEIGAGRGEMTFQVSAKVNRLVSLEIDRLLYKSLLDHAAGYENIELLNIDVLKFDIGSFFQKADKIKIIGNIPYYITSPIISHLFDYLYKINCIYLTLQKELAERLVATSGSKGYGAISCFVQYYTLPKILFSVKRGSFWPRPKVDSCLVELKVRSEPAVTTKDTALFFKIIKAAFGKRRKVLNNSLKDIISRDKLNSFFECQKISRGTRPEDLALEDFARLTDICLQ